jgi:hypothetical protein
MYRDRSKVEMPARSEKVAIARRSAITERVELTIASPAGGNAELDRLSDPATRRSGRATI